MTFCGLPDNVIVVERWARARALAHWSYLGLLTCVVIVGCASGQGRFEPRKLEPVLRQMVAQHPDSVVAVLLRLTRNVQRDDSAALARTGFAIGSARDRIVTGWAAGSTLRLLSGWPQVEWMEMSSTIPMTPRRTGDSRSTGWREIQR